MKFGFECKEDKSSLCDKIHAKNGNDLSVKGCYLTNKNNSSKKLETLESCTFNLPCKNLSLPIPFVASQKDF